MKTLTGSKAIIKFGDEIIGEVKDVQYGGAVTYNTEAVYTLGTWQPAEFIGYNHTSVSYTVTPICNCSCKKPNYSLGHSTTCPSWVFFDIV